VSASFSRFVRFPNGQSFPQQQSTTIGSGMRQKPTIVATISFPFRQHNGRQNCADKLNRISKIQGISSDERYFGRSLTNNSKHHTINDPNSGEHQRRGD
jgi:hypothetical protein